MLHDTITPYIKKLSYPLKEEEELKIVLKRLLTKKEFKIIEYNDAHLSIDEKLLKLRVDAQRLDEMQQNLIKKLNYEKNKHQLMQIKE